MSDRVTTALLAESRLREVEAERDEALCLSEARARALAEADDRIKKLERERDWLRDGLAKCTCPNCESMRRELEARR